MTEMTTDTAQTPRAVAMSLAAAMMYLGNGEIADLRRLDDEAAVPIYWRLAARHEVLARRQGLWVPIVRALAILSSKGPPGERSDLHDAKRKFGTLLCDGGKTGWPGPLVPGQTPRPALSERRLAQLLAARETQRSTLLTRAVRAVAARRDSALGVDVVDLAWAFLKADDAGSIARPYYQRLDRAQSSIDKPEKEITDE